MKRLLAYLIVVISLGLAFSVSAEANNDYCLIEPDQSTNALKKSYLVFKMNKESICDGTIIEDKFETRKLYRYLSNVVRSAGINNIAKRNLDPFLKQKTQIAKTEPSQTQKVVDIFDITLIAPNSSLYFMTNDYRFGGPTYQKFAMQFIKNGLLINDYKFDKSEQIFTHMQWNSTKGIDSRDIRISKKLYIKLLNTSQSNKGKVFLENKNNIFIELLNEYIENTEQSYLKKTLVLYFNKHERYDHVAIAKARPAVKPKKKVKVAKVVEPPREIIPDSDYEKFLYSFEKREFANYVLPNKLNKKFKNCKTNTCRKDKSGKFVYKAFIKNSEKKKLENPGDIIHGMAMYEILFLTKVNMSKKYIARFVKKNPYYDFNKKLDPVAKIFNNSKKMNSLIKMNNTREKLRKSLGMDLSVDINTAISRYWVLGDVLNLGDVKVTKTKLHPDVKKRKKLLKKYQETLAKFNKKLKENENL